MNHTKPFSWLLALGLATVLATAARADDDEKGERKKPEQRAKARVAEPESGMQIVARAKLTRQQAERIALAKVPNGKVKTGKLELDDGVLVWAFDIALPGSDTIAQVAVNAVTGAVVAVDFQAPKAEAKEAKPAKPARKETKAEAKEPKKAKEAKPEVKAVKPKGEAAKKAKPAKGEKGEAERPKKQRDKDKDEKKDKD